MLRGGKRDRNSGVLLVLTSRRRRRPNRSTRCRRHGEIHTGVSEGINGADSDEVTASSLLIRAVVVWGGARPRPAAVGGRESHSLGGNMATLKDALQF